jgi:hypothetical protein
MNFGGLGDKPDYPQKAELAGLSLVSAA